MFLELLATPTDNHSENLHICLSNKTEFDYIETLCISNEHYRFAFQSVKSEIFKCSLVKEPVVNGKWCLTLYLQQFEKIDEHRILFSIHRDHLPQLTEFVHWINRYKNPMPITTTILN